MHGPMNIKKICNLLKMSFVVNISQMFAFEMKCLVTLVKIPAI